MNPYVVAVIATHRRHAELARLLDSLGKIRQSLGGIVVVDNGGDAEAVVKKSKVPAHWLHPGSNLGCGGGLALAEKTALQIHGEALTHLWILDDDAVVHADNLDVLLGEMDSHHAAVACPMIADEHGQAAWPPGLLDRRKYRVIRGRLTPAEFLARCGGDAIPFSWSTGVSLLVTRAAIEQVGTHRADFWVRGEDLEFSLRLTARRRGIFVPKTFVAHLPPPEHAAASRAEEYLKHAAMLQNLCYLSRLPHGRRTIRTLPGNFLRFLKTWRTTEAWKDAALAAWLGGIRGKPAGAPGFNIFQRRLNSAR